MQNLSNDLPLKALHTFSVVTRYNNFQDAADRLYITPSAVSHQIKNLENWFGRPLFNRRGNQLQLLPEGKQLAASLRHSFSEINTACDVIKHDSGTRKLVIAAIPSIATCWLIPKLNDFQQQYPDIELHISYALHNKALDFNEIDLAFVYAKTPPSVDDVLAELFLSGASYPVCSSSFKERQDSAIDISKGPFLQDRDSNNAWQTWFDKAGVKVDQSDKGLAFDDFNLLRSAALAGQGIALCAKALIEDDLQERRLIQLSDIPVNTDSGYYLLQQPDKRHPHSQMFRDWVFEQQ
jgi:DNA-binding transcriptional LysR family regulator